MYAQAIKKFTTDDYLAFERQSEIKHEFWHGELFAMAGSSEAHNLIVTNVVSELRTQLKAVPVKSIRMICACGLRRKKPTLTPMWLSCAERRNSRMTAATRC